MLDQCWRVKVGSVLEGRGGSVLRVRVGSVFEGEGWISVRL